MNSTSIEWCNRPETRGPAGAKTWNPIRARLKEQSGLVKWQRRSGTFCTRISPGCTNCYASAINKRFGNGLEFTVPNLKKIEFFIDERILAEPIKQKKPCTIFVGDMFDLFHEAIPTELIAEVLRVAMKTEWHTFQFLTKRAQRMQNLVNSAQKHWARDFDAHIWFGVSVEDQKRADERIPRLQETRAAVRFLSVEPMLESIDMQPESIDGMPTVNLLTGADWCDLPIPGIDWVIVGGESGHNARPMHPDWIRSLRDQCEAAHVPFFFKQWGEWQPHPEPPDPNGSYHGGLFLLPNGQLGNQGDWWDGRAQAVDRVGKNKAGHLLDGKEYLQFPAVREPVTA